MFAFQKNGVFFTIMPEFPVFRKRRNSLHGAGFVDEMFQTFTFRTRSGTQSLRLAQPRFDCLEQQGIVEGFCDVVVGTQGHAFAKIILFCFGGQKDKRNICSCLMPVQYVQYPEAVELGHHHVAEDQVGALMHSHVNTYFSVFRAAHGVTAQLQYFR